MVGDYPRPIKKSHGVMKEESHQRSIGLALQKLPRSKRRNFVRRAKHPGHSCTPFATGFFTILSSSITSKGSNRGRPLLNLLFTCAHCTALNPLGSFATWLPFPHITTSAPPPIPARLLRIALTLMSNLFQILDSLPFEG